MTPLAAMPWPTAPRKVASPISGLGCWSRTSSIGPIALAGEWPVSLSDAQRQWDTDVRSREIAWHAEPWVQQGAYAAFLGIRLRWRRRHRKPVNSSRRRSEGRDEFRRCAWAMFAAN